MRNRSAEDRVRTVGEGLFAPLRRLFTAARCPASAAGSSAGEDERRPTSQRHRPIQCSPRQTIVHSLRATMQSRRSLMLELIRNDVADSLPYFCTAKKALWKSCIHYDLAFLDGQLNIISLL
jgi:hypothetical protein